MKQLLCTLMLIISLAGTAKAQETEYLGQFRITHYCSCRICNGKWTGYPTAAGTDYVEGRTVAVYGPQIPLGSKVLVGGHEYTAEDTGSKIKQNCIDIFVSRHQEALELGVYYSDVYLIKE